MVGEGAGIHIKFCVVHAERIIVRNNMIDVKYGASGGGIGLQNPCGPYIFNDSEISWNEVHSDVNSAFGGGFHSCYRWSQCDNRDTIYFNNVKMLNNYSSSLGGVHATIEISPYIKMDSCEIYRNNTRNGSCFYSNRRIEFLNSIFSENEGRTLISWFGIGGNITVNKCLFKRNNCERIIECSPNGSTPVTNSVFVENEGYTIYSLIYTSTFTGRAFANLNHCTFYLNKKGLHLPYCSFYASNCIFFLGC